MASTRILSLNCVVDGYCDMFLPLYRGLERTTSPVKLACRHGLSANLSPGDPISGRILLKLRVKSSKTYFLDDESQ